MKKVTTILVMLAIATLTFAQEKEQRDDDDRVDIEVKKKKNRYGTSHGLSFDIGINNYLKDGKSPDDSNENYAAKPWGSWNFAINSVNNTHIGGPLYLQWGGGFSWYNFQFQDEAMRISKGANEVDFTLDPRTNIDPIKSKFSASYVNVSLLPVLRFGENGRKRWGNDNWCFDNDKEGKFRIGVGGYAGYKLGSRSKFVYEEENIKRKDKATDSYYLNSWRYGARLQVGFRDVDFFVNYDLNELFVTDKGPKLNAFSFGITI